MPAPRIARLYRVCLPGRIDEPRLPLPTGLEGRFKSIAWLVDWTLVDASSSWNRPGDEDAPRVELRRPVLDLVVLQDARPDDVYALVAEIERAAGAEGSTVVSWPVEVRP